MRNNQRRSRPSGQPTPAPVIKAAPASSSLTYEVPTEFVELPSRGLFYPEDHPLYKQETVEIKFMTAKEEDILASSALLKKGLLLDRLFENILIEDIDPQSLLIGDRSAIMVAARASGYGKIYETALECPTCSAKNTLLYDLSTVKLSEYCFDEEYINDNSIEINDNIFFITLPVTKTKVGLRLLDGYGEKEFSELSANNGDNKVTSTLSAFIEVVGETYDRKEINNFIDSMPVRDSKYIRTIYPKLVPNIELKENFTCTRCSHQQEMEVPLTAEFFWPR
jgi:hypothetical protein